MKGLSRKQLEILTMMYNQNLVLACNEGADYKCWLQDAEGNRVNYSLSRTTGNALADNGWIVLDEEYKGRWFYNKLSPKAKKIFDK